MARVNSAKAMESNRMYLYASGGRWLEDHRLKSELQLLPKLGSSLGHVRDGSSEDSQEVVGGRLFFGLLYKRSRWAL